MRKIAVVTGSRAEWGLLEPLLCKMCDYGFPIDLYVTGAHCSLLHGQTEIEIAKQWDFERVPIVMAEDSRESICNSFGMAISHFGLIWGQEKPAYLLVLGDRYEILAACIAAHIHNIPIIHIHGGEITKGAYDNAFRHSISHMASIHFPATIKAEVFLNDMGKRNIYDVGALGCEGLEKYEGERENKLIVLCHPETLGEFQLDFLYSVLKDRMEYLIFIGPNADNGSDKILSNFVEYFNRYEYGYELHKSLTRDIFIQELKTAKAIIGNSSCGIIEAPVLGTPTINIGDRQKGRERASSIIDCQNDSKSIKAGFAWLDSGIYDFSTIPYNGGIVSERITKIVRGFLYD